MRSTSSIWWPTSSKKPAMTLRRGGVQRGQGLGDGGDVGLELGALVGVVDHAQEGAVGVAALGVPGGLVVGVHLALAVAVLALVSMGSSRAAVACSIMVPYWPMSVMRRSICRAMARASS
jgi:hypothetical protein